ncbi:MAG: hypothetical protein GXO24_01545 [Chlorobi bacterium]|nr:hypothetical protein [Chlorobiota bacterium]
MKKIFWLMIWFPALVWSQEGNTRVAKGKFYLNASSLAQWSYITSGFGDFSNGESVYLLQAGGGYTVTDNWVAGLNVRLDHTDTWISKPKWLVGPFVRYYIPYRRVLFFMHGGMSYGTQNLELDYVVGAPAGSSIHITYLNYEFMAGLAIPLNDYIHFDIMAGYDALTYKTDREHKITENWGMKWGFSVFLDK